MINLNKVKLIFSIAICQLAGVVGAIFTSRSVSTWFMVLRKPWFAPPNWVFGPVWISLYFLMGLSLYLMLFEDLGEPRARKALFVFGVQLVVNAGWSYSFFGLRNPFYGFIVIVVLLFLIILTMALFWKIKPDAAYLLVPYLIWVSFATLVSFSIWRLNL
jgi:tryptophan-rich sensory protein